MKIYYKPFSLDTIFKGETNPSGHDYHTPHDVIAMAIKDHLSQTARNNHVHVEETTCFPFTSHKKRSEDFEPV